MLMRNQSHFTAEIVETEPMYREKSWMTKKRNIGEKEDKDGQYVIFFFGV